MLMFASVGVFIQVCSALGSIWSFSVARKLFISVELGAVLSAGFLVIYVLARVNLDLGRDLGRDQSRVLGFFWFSEFILSHSIL
jgi:hypothetical protein